MRILYDSKQLQYKTPFGTLTPGEKCTMTMYVPSAVGATMVSCIINRENSQHQRNANRHAEQHHGQPACRFGIAQQRHSKQRRSYNSNNITPFLFLHK